MKPAANKAKPRTPAKTQDVEDIERADGEGMAQEQGLTPEQTPVPAPNGRKSATSRGAQRSTKRQEIAKKAVTKGRKKI